MRLNYWHTFQEENFYHIYNRTNSNDLLFLDYADRRYFLRQWQYYFRPYLDTYAYCLMSNHFHFVVRVKKPDEAFFRAVQYEETIAATNFLNDETDVNTFLEDQFKRFFSSFAQTFNKKYKRHGSLFQKKFKRIELTMLDTILSKICYVHHNPLHHGASTTYDGWEFSSYKAYISDKPTRVCRDDGLTLFDDNQSVSFFIQYHEEYHRNWTLNQKWKDFDDTGDI